MRTYLSRVFKTHKGFTLIELLVVIGILGILAATLVATIDPFEQIKKGNDTKVQNVAVEFQTALVRYYTGQNGFPWDADSACATDAGSSASTNAGDDSQDITTAVTLDGLADTCVQDLVDVGELKAGFKQVTGALDKIYLSEQNNTPVVCYLPTSKSGQKDKAVIYSDSDGTVNTGTGTAACQSTTGGEASCYWCTQ